MPRLVWRRAGPYAPRNQVKGPVRPAGDLSPDKPDTFWRLFGGGLSNRCKNLRRDGSICDGDHGCRACASGLGLRARASLAYLLSAFAAVVYIVATVSLARGNAPARRVATVAISVELVGVITAGAVSELVSNAFPEATVWTGFGSGYGFVPLVLPFAGLWWLRHTR